MYNNELIFANKGVPKFKKVSVLTHDNTPWEHYENAYVHIAADYVVIDAREMQILLPRESIKVIMAEGKIW